MNSKTDEEKISIIATQIEIEVSVLGDFPVKMLSSPLNKALLNISSDNQDMAEAIFSCFDEEQKFDILCNRPQTANDRDINFTNFAILYEIRQETVETTALEFVLDNIEPHTLMRALTAEYKEEKLEEQTSEEVTPFSNNDPQQEDYENPSVLEVVLESIKPKIISKQMLLASSYAQKQHEIQTPTSNNLLEELICSHLDEGVELVLQKVASKDLVEVLEKAEPWTSLQHAYASLEEEETLKVDDVIYRHLGRAIAYAANEQSSELINVKIVNSEGDYDINVYINPSELDSTKDNPFEKKLSKFPKLLLRALLRRKRK